LCVVLYARFEVFGVGVALEMRQPQLSNFCLGRSITRNLSF